MTPSTLTSLPLFGWGSRTAYPTVPGFKARATSRAAAKAIAPRQRQLQQRVLAALEQGPATADETAARIGESILAVRPRCSELSLPCPFGTRPALICDSGVRRRNASGKAAIVWQKL